MAQLASAERLLSLDEAILHVNTINDVSIDARGAVYPLHPLSNVDARCVGIHYSMQKFFFERIDPLPWRQAIHNIFMRYLSMHNMPGIRWALFVEHLWSWRAPKDSEVQPLLRGSMSDFFTAIQGQFDDQCTHWNGVPVEKLNFFAHNDVHRVAIVNASVMPPALEPSATQVTRHFDWRGFSDMAWGRLMEHYPHLQLVRRVAPVECRLQNFVQWMLVLCRVCGVDVPDVHFPSDAFARVRESLRENEPLKAYLRAHVGGDYTLLFAKISAYKPSEGICDVLCDVALSLEHVSRTRAIIEVARYILSNDACVMRRVLEARSDVALGDLQKLIFFNRKLVEQYYCGHLDSVDALFKSLVGVDTQEVVFWHHNLHACEGCSPLLVRYDSFVVRMQDEEDLIRFSFSAGEGEKFVLLYRLLILIQKKGQALPLPPLSYLGSPLSEKMVRYYLQALYHVACKPPKVSVLEKIGFSHNEVQMMREGSMTPSGEPWRAYVERTRNTSGLGWLREFDGASGLNLCSMSSWASPALIYPFFLKIHAQDAFLNRWRDVQAKLRLMYADLGYSQPCFRPLVVPASSRAFVHLIEHRFSVQERLIEWPFNVRSEGVERLSLSGRPVQSGMDFHDDLRLEENGVDSVQGMRDADYAKMLKSFKWRLGHLDQEGVALGEDVARLVVLNYDDMPSDRFRTIIMGELFQQLFERNLEIFPEAWQRYVYAVVEERVALMS